MVEVTFASAFQRHLPQPARPVEATTVAEALDLVFHENPSLRGYVLDDQGQARHHVVVFLDGEQIRDPVQLSDAVRPNSKIHVIQALSGG